ncbi:MAG: hypothetical protein AAGA21_19315, partial [Pseudomonadota bacterium]
VAIIIVVIAIIIVIVTIIIVVIAIIIVVIAIIIVVVAIIIVVIAIIVVVGTQLGYADRHPAISRPSQLKRRQPDEQSEGRTCQDFAGRRFHRRPRL